MIFYQNPVALNRANHLNLKLDQKPGDFSFAGKTNSVLLAVSEMAEAAKDYPIVFVGKEGGTFTLAALVGLRDSENLFVGEDGSWQAGNYIPAFARRYPFVLAEGEGSADKLTVCIDEAYAGFNTERGNALFDNAGKETPMLQAALDFLQLFHGEMNQTRLFAQQLAALGLLEQKIIEVNREGKQEVLEGLFIVDQQKLKALDDAASLELLRSGAMFFIHAHLLSLGHVERLAMRLDRHIAATAIAPATLAASAASATSAAPAAPAAATHLLAPARKGQQGKGNPQGRSHNGA